MAIYFKVIQGFTPAHIRDWAFGTLGRIEREGQRKRGNAAAEHEGERSSMSDFIKSPEKWLLGCGMKSNIRSWKEAGEIPKRTAATLEHQFYRQRSLLMPRFLTQRYEIWGRMSNNSRRHAMFVPKDEIFWVRREADKHQIRLRKEGFSFSKWIFS